MPIKKSAAKALRQSKKREARNKVIKENINWLRRQFLKAIASKKKKQAADIYLQLQKVLDRAVQKGVLKKNTAARKKSRAVKKLNAIKK
ncbi:30S ribosomal protein S20 [Patescibacteria group bacterium AH-259-L07]|nr:30S ribosomal protein S20 [Patescibacteria group bacterium AH-259-L07]